MKIEQTSMAFPSQWDITLDDGTEWYVRYRWGELTVDPVHGDELGDGCLTVTCGDPLDGEMTTAEMMAILGLDGAA
jgi:hypothetical protein